MQALQEQARHRYVKLWLRNSASDYLRGTVTQLFAKYSILLLNYNNNSRYSYGQFVEINSHSLFSKWFSEVCKIKNVIKTLFTHCTMD